MNKNQKPKLVEMVEKICEECTSYREQAVELVRLSDERRCPFFSPKSNVCGDYDACRLIFAFEGRNDCTGMGNIPPDCPVRKSPYYHEGKVYLIKGVRYIAKEQKKS